MREECGVMAASGAGLAEFLHLTLLEYLAALGSVPSRPVRPPIDQSNSTKASSTPNRNPTATRGAKSGEARNATGVCFAHARRSR